MAPRLHPGPPDTAPQTPPSIWNYSICRPPGPESFRKSYRNHPNLCSNNHSQTWHRRHPEQPHHPPRTHSTNEHPRRPPGGPQAEATETKLSSPPQRPRNIGFPISSRNNWSWHSWPLQQPNNCLPASPPPQPSKELSPPPSPWPKQNLSILLSTHFQRKAQHHVDFTPICSPFSLY